MTTEFICLDETMKMVSTKRRARRNDGSVVEINCPSGYNILIKGKGCSFEKYKLQIKITDEYKHELSEDSEIYIYKREISEAQTLLTRTFYRDICYKKEDKEVFEFENNILLKESDCLSIDVKNPDKDIYYVNLILDIELIRLNHN